MPKPSVELKVHNSTCWITGLNMDQTKDLRELMSYRLNPTISYYTGGFKSDKRYLMTKKGAFPTGLLYIFEEYAKKTRMPYVLNDIRRAPRPLPSTSSMRMLYPPYELQKKALESIYEGRGIIVAPTGFGKSYLIALIINKLNVKTLVVVPTLELKRQLTETLSSLFTSQTPPFRVENVDALDTKIPVTDCDCVIIDEFHHSASKTYRKLNEFCWSQIYYKFGLTATPFRSQDNERLLLESVLSKVIYEVDYSNAVDQGHIVPLEAYYIDVPRTKFTGNPKSWPSVYNSLITLNHARNTIIALILARLSKASTPAICLVKEIEHGKKLVELTGDPFANGQDGSLKQILTDFNSGKTTSIIGTTGVLGEGVDTKPCQFVVIAGLGKSRNAFMQQCGRAFRRFPGKDSAKVIIFRDPTHKYTLNHFREQCRFLKEEYGVVPIKVDMGDDSS